MSKKHCTVLLLFSLFIFLQTSTTAANRPAQEESVMISGMVIDKKTNKPTASKISVKDYNSHEVLSQYYSDSKSGKYVFVLNEGLYNIVIEAKGFQIYTEDLDVRNIVGGELKKNFSILPIGFKDIDVPKVSAPPAEKKLDNASTNPDFLNAPAKKEESKPVLPASQTPVTEVQVLTRDGTRYISNNIQFEKGQYTLSPESINELNQIVVFLRNNADMRIEIGSHTDAGGDSKNNMQLTEQRANEITEYINYQGISKERLVPKGYGSTQPLVTGQAGGGKMKNERLELKVLKTETQQAAVSPSTKPASSTESQNTEVPTLASGYQERYNPEIARMRARELEQIHTMRIYFVGKKPKIAPPSYPTLDSVVAFMNKYEKVSLAAIGYSELITSKSKSLKASQERAKSVVDYLNSRGIEKSRITWKGAGSTKFIALNKTKQGQQKNRRVEFEVSGVQSEIDISMEPILSSIEEPRKEEPKNEEPKKEEPAPVKKEETPPVSSSATETPSSPTPTAPEPSPPPPPVVTPAPVTPAPVSKSMDDLYYEMLRDYGEFTKDNLIFKIQVGAFLNPLVPTSPLYQKVPDAKGEKGADGLTRYYSGMFRKLNDAERVRQEILAKGITGAWVVAFYNGSKMTRPQMLELFGSVPEGVR